MFGSLRLELDQEDPIDAIKRNKWKSYKNPQ